MKLRISVVMVLLCLLMGGCSWLDGTYHSITPHQEQSGSIRTENLTISTYQELISTMEDIVSKGTESCVISAVNYDPEQLESNLRTAAWKIQHVYPVGAYAVDSLNYEIGTGTGKTAIALNITYRHSRTEIRKIKKVWENQRVSEIIGEAMEDYETVLVLEMQQYEQLDFTQIVQDYAMEHPQNVMEIPNVTSEVYGVGQSRMVELTFSYQTSRDALRTMQHQVQPVFDSAILYVSGEGSQGQKFSQLYGFLMERFDYIVETSITPAYSLLRHGVGDSRAFATVYAAMCRASELDCVVVTGTRSGEPWTWNIICEDGVYSHVDLLRCNENGRFQQHTDEQMVGYVWDYSAYPACVSREGAEEPAAETQEMEETKN